MTGMKFRDGDELISRTWLPRAFVFVVTEGGYAKRTSVDDYRVQGRNGFGGIKVAKLVEDRGALVVASLWTKRTRCWWCGQRQGRSFERE